MSEFIGFRAPRYTQIPDALIDHFLPDLSGAEIKVALYIARRTLGWSKENDQISLQQIQHGIRRKDGSVLDRGTGLSGTTTKDALTSLSSKRIIIRTRVVSDAHGCEASLYRLNVIDKNPATPGRSTGQGGGRSTGQALAGPPAPQSGSGQHTDPQDPKTEREKQSDSLSGGDGVINCLFKTQIREADRPPTASRIEIQKLELSHEDIALASAAGLDPVTELTALRDWYLAQGRTSFASQAAAAAAWRNWIRRGAEYRARHPAPAAPAAGGDLDNKNPHPGMTDAEYAAAEMAARRRGVSVEQYIESQGGVEKYVRGGRS